MTNFVKFNYKDLNARQKENYNFQKVAAILADYGFNCIRLSDDWHGADFIAIHVDGVQLLKVQLKSVLAFDKKYNNREIHVAFMENNALYIYNHDFLQEKMLRKGYMVGTASWDENGRYSWPKMPANIFDIMQEYCVTNPADANRR